MTRFINMPDGTKYNISQVNRFWMGGEKLTVDFRGRGAKTYEMPCGTDYWKDEILGVRHVVQVIPCTMPVYMVYEQDDGTEPYIEQVRYLGLCADGCLRALELSDGYYEVVEDDGCTAALCYEDNERVQAYLRKMRQKGEANER